MKMTAKEMRELDAWIEKQVFGRSDVAWGNCFGEIEWDADKPCPRDFTTSPAHSMCLLKKCAEELDSDCDIEITAPQNRDGENWLVIDTYGEWKGQAGTLELSIALFAKSLYSK